MSRWSIRCLLAISCLGVSNLPTPSRADEAAAGATAFQPVRDLLIKHCLECHGGADTKADLDLSTQEGLLQGGQSGAAVAPGNAAESLLVLLVTHEEEPFMPHQRAKLADADIERLKDWINAGAKYDAPLIDAEEKERLKRTEKELVVTDADRQFWSFRPLKQVAPPAVTLGAWCRTPIDRFILAELEAKQLSPAAPADRGKLIRRAYYDLVGLPPTPADVDAVLGDAAFADPRPDAYERTVERLLDSPRYGERWARHWLDVARYGDSSGYERDDDRPNAYPYRDFVIRALNDDLPFNVFVQWQLAGDELAPGNPLARAATGFCTCGPFLTTDTKLESELARYRYDELDDILSTTGAAMLGLTIGCARCHDHKYDPIPQRDYYSLLSAFVSSKRVADTEALTLTDVGPQPLASPLMLRGDPEHPGEKLPLGFLTVLVNDPAGIERWKPAPSASSSDSPSTTSATTTQQRTALANWMTDTDKGAGALVARVIVNRLWQHHFGEGLVRTPGDFGAQGQRPTHPELLDWLAGELVAGGWRLKPIHRLIMASAVYRQDTTHDPAKAAIDPDNRLLWHRRPLRLEVETLRDAMLAVSGCLNPQMFGPGVKPPIPADAIAARNSKEAYPTGVPDGPDTWRRSIYIFVKRSVRLPLLEIFDSPSPIAACSRRNQSTVAPQALALLNDTFARDQARHFATRLAAEAGEKAEDRIALAYRLALSRPPTSTEMATAQKFIAEQFSRRANANQNGLYNAWVDFCQVLLNLNEFLYID